MRSPLSMILTFVLTLALSLPGRAQSARPEESCVNVNVSVEVNISVEVTLGDDGSVNLAWQTGPEPDTAGFNIHRADPEGPYTQLNDALIQPQRGRGSGSGDSYTFVDTPGNSTDYYYMLKSL